MTTVCSHLKNYIKAGNWLIKSIDLSNIKLKKCASYIILNILRLIEELYLHFRQWRCRKCIRCYEILDDRFMLLNNVTPAVICAYMEHSIRSDVHMISFWIARGTWALIIAMATTCMYLFFEIFRGYIYKNGKYN